MILEVEALLFEQGQGRILGSLDSFFHSDDFFVELLVGVHEPLEMGIAGFERVDCVAMLGEFGDEGVMIEGHGFN